MSSINGGGSLVGSLLTLLLVGVVAIIALKLAVAIAGMLLGLMVVALFTLGPILLVGWLVVKALRHFSRETGTTPAY
jgi:hypothetical protein